MRLAEQTNSAPEITGRDDYRNATPRNFTSAMNYTEIINQVVTIIDRSDFPVARATGVVARARAQIQRRNDWTFFHQLGEGREAGLLFVGQYADLPEDFAKALSLAITTIFNGQPQKIYPQATSIEVLQEQIRLGVWRRHGGAQEWYWAVDGGRVVLNRDLPDEAEVTLQYSTADGLPATDTDYFSAQCPDVLIYGAVRLAFIELGEEQRANAIYAPLFESELAVAIKRDRESGPTATVYTPPPRGTGQRGSMYVRGNNRGLRT